MSISIGSTRCSSRVPSRRTCQRRLLDESSRYRHLLRVSALPIRVCWIPHLYSQPSAGTTGGASTSRPHPTSLSAASQHQNLTQLGRRLQCRSLGTSSYHGDRKCSEGIPRSFCEGSCSDWRLGERFQRGYWSGFGRCQNDGMLCCYP